MLIRDALSYTYNNRQLYLGKEHLSSWKLNSRYVYQIEFKIDAHLLGRTFKNSFFYFAEQNPKTRTKEAYYVRTGRWKSSDIIWAWLTIPNEYRRIWIGLRSPEGIRVFNGYSISKSDFFMNKPRSCNGQDGPNQQYYV